MGHRIASHGGPQAIGGGHTKKEQTKNTKHKGLSALLRISECFEVSLTNLGGPSVSAHEPPAAG